jgi:hypothetical protein
MHTMTWQVPFRADRAEKMSRFACELETRSMPTSQELIKSAKLPLPGQEELPTQPDTGRWPPPSTKWGEQGTETLPEPFMLNQEVYVKTEVNTIWRLFMSMHTQGPSIIDHTVPGLPGVQWRCGRMVKRLCTSSFQKLLLLKNCVSVQLY